MGHSPIEATCEFFGKTQDQLWSEVEHLTGEYERVMRASAHAMLPMDPIESPILEF